MYQMSLKEDSFFNMMCTVHEGSPPLFFEWIRNGQSVKSGPEVNYKIENSKMFSTFTIEKIERRDAANYSCVVSNSMGSDRQSVLLTIKVYSEIEELTVPLIGRDETEGSLFQIFCSISRGSLPLFFEWTQNEHQIKSSPDVNYKIENFEMFSTFTIKNIQRSDSANYTCLVKNAIGSNMPKLVAFPNRVQTLGSYFQVFCTIQDGSLPLVFEWSRNGQKLKSSAHLNYKIENFERHSTLTIASIEKTDVGNYTCLVTNTLGTDRQGFDLSIRALKLTPLLSPRTQNEGSMFQMTCPVQEGSPPLFFEWLINGQIVKSKPDVNYKIENFKKYSTFTIDEIQRNDSANYTCIVRNALESDTLKLTPLLSPRTQSIDSYFQITCTIQEGSPPLFFEWVINGQTVKSSPYVNYKIENYKMFSTFTIEKIMRSDSANYTCIVRDSVGIPKLSSGLSHKNQSIGSNFQMICTLEEGSYPVFFEWSKNGQTIKSSPDVNYKIDNFEMHSTFTIKSIDMSDVGNYTCVVSNEFGSNSRSTLLSINALKLTPLLSPRTQSMGSVLQVTCAIQEGSPPLFFEWAINGHTVMSSPDVNYKIENFEIYLEAIPRTIPVHDRDISTVDNNFAKGRGVQAIVGSNRDTVSHRRIATDGQRSRRQNNAISDTMNAADIRRAVSDAMANNFSVSSIKCEKFDGKISVDAREWLERYEQFANARNLSDDQKMANFSQYLSEKAYKWYKLNVIKANQPPADWDELKDAFLVYHVPGDLSDELRDKMINRKQGTDEDVIHYITDKRLLCLDWQAMPYSDIKKYIIEGMNDKMKETMYHKNSASINALISDAISVQKGIRSGSGWAVTTKAVENRLARTEDKIDEITENMGRILGRLEGRSRSREKSMAGELLTAVTVIASVIITLTTLAAHQLRQTGATRENDRLVVDIEKSLVSDIIANPLNTNNYSSRSYNNSANRDYHKRDYNRNYSKREYNRDYSKPDYNRDYSRERYEKSHYNREHNNLNNKGNDNNAVRSPPTDTGSEVTMIDDSIRVNLGLGLEPINDTNIYAVNGEKVTLEGRD
ncbi:unnamed protein product [Medioppia subpectinata]|uniref:Ig-like domain-containing protein n=1 Tax=Medioppia subpectinata TaxID=1979941 RepID=A0A7R9KR24_9ACAR|nr:unnamed protein product [Medioppia subpectinata]CAG2107019.1 unnamed protein product [Medioppia subpectinata]